MNRPEASGLPLTSQKKASLGLKSLAKYLIIEVRPAGNWREDKE